MESRATDVLAGAWSLRSPTRRRRRRPPNAPQATSPSTYGPPRKQCAPYALDAYVLDAPPRNGLPRVVTGLGRDTVGRRVPISKVSCNGKSRPGTVLAARVYRWSPANLRGQPIVSASQQVGL